MPQPYTNRLLWSTEGGGLFNPGGAALSPAQKLAGGALSPLLDVTGYRVLWLEILLASFTGGTTPSFQPEWDAVDDAAVANVIPLIKPSALTAAGNLLWKLGAALAATPPVVAGWTSTNYQDDFGCFGQIKATIAGAPTAIAYQMFLYGK